MVNTTKYIIQAPPLFQICHPSLVRKTACMGVVISYYYYSFHAMYVCMVIIFICILHALHCNENVCMCVLERVERERIMTRSTHRCTCMHTVAHPVADPKRYTFTCSPLSTPAFLTVNLSQPPSISGQKQPWIRHGTTVEHRTCCQRNERGLRFRWTE